MKTFEEFLAESYGSFYTKDADEWKKEAEKRGHKVVDRDMHGHVAMQGEHEVGHFYTENEPKYGFLHKITESSNPGLDALYHKKMAAKAASEGKPYNSGLEDAAQAAAKKKLTGATK